VKTPPVPVRAIVISILFSGRWGVADWEPEVWMAAVCVALAVLWLFVWVFVRFPRIVQMRREFALWVEEMEYRRRKRKEEENDDSGEQKPPET
jgi:hypothetical protein